MEKKLKEILMREIKLPLTVAHVISVLTVINNKQKELKEEVDKGCPSCALKNMALEQLGRAFGSALMATGFTEEEMDYIQGFINGHEQEHNTTKHQMKYN